ncbi:MAG: hypothetical protein H7334_11555 [Ferruginibacter sp.]|nr:hypothetical protein [Ferruginibacter sp.]
MDGKREGQQVVFTRKARTHWLVYGLYFFAIITIFIGVNETAGKQQ